MRIVVKVGTSTLAYGTGRLNIRHTEQLVKVLSDLKNEGHEVILVSSGAIGMGVGKLSLPQRPKDTASKQACAAVGQCELMYTYDRLFNAYNHTVAQILLTGVDVEHTDRRVNFQTTLNRLLELGALPIINENDTVATDEITSIGDNDTLAAIVACCCKADLLVLLSDIDGLYTANPHTHPDAALIPLVEEITPEVMALADGAGSALGTGGMATKLRAARMVTGSGADMVIANGAHPEVLYDIADGKPAGTRFKGRRQEDPARRHRRFWKPPARQKQSLHWQAARLAPTLCGPCPTGCATRKTWRPSWPQTPRIWPPPRGTSAT